MLETSATAADGPRPIAVGRFDATSAEGGVTLAVRGFGPATRAFLARLTSLSLAALVPGVLVAAAPRATVAAMLLAPVLGLGAAVAERIYTTRHGLYETGPWSLVRRRLEIRRAEPGDHRHAPHAAHLVLDGKALDADDPPRVVIARSVHFTWMDRLVFRHYVSLVFRRRVLRVDAPANMDDAFTLARLIGEALGIEVDPCLVLEGYFERTLVGASVILAALVSFIGPLSWVALADVAEEGTRLAVAALVAAASAVGAQRVGRLAGAAHMAGVAETAYGIEVGARPSRRRAWIGAALWGVAAVALTGGGCSAGPKLSGALFELGNDRLLFTDVGGDPSPIGLVYRDGAQRIAAIDPRTGRPRWSLPVAGYGLRLDLRGPVALAVGEHGSPAQTTAIAFDPRTGERRWDTGAVGRLHGVFFKDGCVVVSLAELWDRPSYRAFDLGTGMSCAAIAPVDAPDRRSTPAETVDYWERAPPLAAAEQEQTPPVRDLTRKRGSVEIAGATYTLDATGETMMLSAAGGGAAWTVALPAGAAPGLPFAAGDGLVLVAGCAVRRAGRGCRLRLIGLDAATGHVRFVERRPEPELGPTDVAIVAGKAIVAWGIGLHAYDVLTGELSWTTSAR